MKQFRPSTKKALLHILIESHIGAPEPVYRLLRIADQEEFAGNRAGSLPVRLVGVVGGEQEENLGLERIGVLELVDEKVSEALLQLVTDSDIIANEITCLDEEVEEIEAPRLALQEFIARDRCLQSVMEQRGKIGVACRNEGVDIGLGSVATSQGFVPRNAPEGRSLGALPLPAPPPCQTAHLGLKPVVIATADSLHAGRLFNETCNLCQIAGKIIVGPRARGSKTSELGHLVDQRVDGATPVEGIPPPPFWKIAALAKAVHRVPQLFARGLARSASEVSSVSTYETDSAG